MDRLQHDRLKWKCRRGLLELDLVLERFLRREGKTLSESDAAALSELLEQPDNDLWELVIGRSDRVDARLRGILAQLRAC
ncbi:MAG: succinate dehydrogenase assembly factor 2 [Betaproteobacteria bacterium]|jgi:antitoxin CptB|nr:succinate dehydrogenase assembly factor 2 [Betaproteobacteria bacterium]